VHETGVKESWSNKSPYLPSLFNLTSIFPTKCIKSPWIRCQELCIYYSVDPERYDKHYDVNEYDEDCKSATSHRRTQIYNDSIKEALVSSSLFSVLTLRLSSVEDARDQASVFFIRIGTTAHPFLLLALFGLLGFELSSSTFSFTA